MVRKVFRRRIRRQEDGVNVAADINAVVSLNKGEPGKSSRTRVRSRSRIVQRSDGTTKGSGKKSHTDGPTEGGEQSG